MYPLQLGGRGDSMAADLARVRADESLSRVADLLDL